MAGSVKRLHAIQPQRNPVSARSEPEVRQWTADFWQSVLAQASPVYVVDPAGRLLYANDGYRRIVGLLGLDDRPNHVQLPDHHRRFALEVLHSGADLTRRENIMTRDGAYHFSARHFVVRDTEGRAVAAAGLFVDTTSETAAIGRAVRERHRLTDVMRASSDWIWETDKNGTLTFVSDRITDALGLPAAMVIGRKLHSIGLFPAAETTPNAAIDGFRQRRPFRDAAMTLPLTPGAAQNSRVFHMSGVPVFDETGQFGGFRGAGSDVTARIRAEDSARTSRRALEGAMQELTNQNAQLALSARRATAAKHAKQEFLATMSHELRTPLNAIIGFADLMGLQPFGTLGERYVDYVQEVSKAGHHLLSIINDILDVARIEADNLPLHIRPTPLRDLVRDARAMVELRAEAKRIDITMFDYGGAMVLNVDPTRCIQIFVNLLANGVKFTPDGGTIGLNVDTDPTTGDALVKIWDTGPGIAADAQALIFDKFQQIHDDIFSRSNDGVGLGLTLSRQFAQLMSGDLWVESSPGHGSRFIVRLPLGEATGAESEESPA